MGIIGVVGGELLSFGTNCKIGEEDITTSGKKRFCKAKVDSCSQYQAGKLVKYAGERTRAGSSDNGRLACQGQGHVFNFWQKEEHRVKGAMIGLCMLLFTTYIVGQSGGGESSGIGPWTMETAPLGKYSRVNPKKSWKIREICTSLLLKGFKDCVGGVVYCHHSNSC